MKYISFVSRTMVLAMLIVAVFPLLSSCNGGNAGTNPTAVGNLSQNGSTPIEGKLPVAYINVDSILINYQYAKDVNDRLTKKMEDNRVIVNQKQKKLESESADFKKKYENNAFLSAETAQQAYNRLQKQEQELGALMERMQNEWLMEQNKENMQLADSVRKAIEIINADGQYEMIFNMREGDNILYAKPQYDITQNVLSLLNTRYQQANK